MFSPFSLSLIFLFFYFCLPPEALCPVWLHLSHTPGQPWIQEYHNIAIHLYFLCSNVLVLKNNTDLSFNVQLEKHMWALDLYKNVLVFLDEFWSMLLSWGQVSWYSFYFLQFIVHIMINYYYDCRGLHISYICVPHTHTHARTHTHTRTHLSLIHI